MTSVAAALDEYAVALVFAPNTNRSAPAPPVKLSLPMPPVIVSAPSPPEIVSLPAPPTKLSASAEPVIVMVVEVAAAVWFRPVVPVRADALIEAALVAPIDTALPPVSTSAPVPPVSGVIVTVPSV